MSASRELARRAVACKHWRWLPGMQDLNSAFGPRRIIGITSTGQVHSAHGLSGLRAGAAEETSVRTADAFRVPDLDDPATCGCLLALVREAWGDPNLFVEYVLDVGHRIASDIDARMRVWDSSPHVKLSELATEAEALVAALEAAP